MTIELYGASLQEGAMDGLSLLEVYVGAEKIWPNREVVQITIGRWEYPSGQLWDALDERGLDEDTVTEIPFDIELVGSGDTDYMFANMYSLTRAPAMDTSRVTSMAGMFEGCESLVYVPDMNTSQVEYMYSMFYGCYSLTDGNVRLIGKHPWVETWDMIAASGLTREPFYNTNGNPI